MMGQQTSRKGWIAGFLIIGTLLVGGDWTEAATANGPYYAPPAWARKMPVNARFVVLKNWNSEAVLDRETGLVWERAPQVITRTWADARFTCATKVIGNRKGWRLPTVVELTTLVDPSINPPGPTLPPGHPFTNVPTFFFWSATTAVDQSQLAWAVFFYNGSVGPLDKTNELWGWCVRGGMNADQY